MSFLEICKREAIFLWQEFFSKEVVSEKPTRRIPGYVTEEELDIERENILSKVTNLLKENPELSCSWHKNPTPAIMSNGEIRYGVWERPTPPPRLISE